MTQSCEDRIRGHLEGRLSYARALADVQQARQTFAEIDPHSLEVLDLRDEAMKPDVELEDIQEQATEQAYELPLAVEVRRVVRIDLSTGGPADWFEVHVDEDGEPTRIEYHFSDWFDHASRALDGDEYDAARGFLAPFVEGALVR